MKNREDTGKRAATALVGDVALVTGATGGIGQAVVRTLAEAGVRVAAVDLDTPALAELERTARDKGLPVTAFAADVTSPAAEVEAVVAAVEERLGPIDQLVNVAGLMLAAPVLSLTDEDWERTFAVNASGVFRVSSAVARRMAGRGRGAVVTVASNAAVVPRAGMAAYAASKAAAVAFTKNLGLELARHGVRCNAVCPGSTDTAMLRSLWSDDDGPDRSLRGSLEDFRVGIPLGRFAAPQDVADAVAFLLSERATHITMHDLQVDGGAALGR